jgi:hypothetical protein
MGMRLMQTAAEAQRGKLLEKTIPVHEQSWQCY